MALGQVCYLDASYNFASLTTAWMGRPVESTGCILLSLEQDYSSVMLVTGKDLR